MSQDSLIGHSLGGRYKIEELLGRGGMSSVYKATDPNLRRVVAIKLIHPHLSDDPEFVRRFETEASAVAQLRHPNIVQVYDFNSEEGTYYMVLEFVPGETLQDRLKRLNAQERHMDLANVTEFGASISSAVDYAHKKGMIHRDIKPANIVLNIQDEAILMDFGITKIVGGTQHTATGAVLGTALYMSPEQIRGEHPDHRTDIYSLGVTLFEMVGGRPPYEADSVMSLMMMHLHDPLPDLSAINPETPPALVAVINKALEKEPGDRYQSASELATALHASLSAPPPVAPETAVEKPDSGPTVVEAAAAAAVASSQPELPAAEATLQESPAAAVPARSSEATFSEESTGGPGAASGSASTPPPAAPPAAKSLDSGDSGGFFQSSTGRLLMYGGGGLIILVILAVLGSQFLGGGDSEEGGNGSNNSAVLETAPAFTQTVGALALAEPSETPEPPTDTPEPTETPTPTVTPTSTTTPPPEPYVLITDIMIGGSSYVVEYETFGYTEELPGMHIHFYYDTVPETEAGSPGNGPWILYGGPRPFQGYTVGSRPAAASQMCARVANPNHSIIFDSGNCFDLPDV